MTDTQAVALRVASFCTTCECANAENPRPPYCLGMIMPRKPRSFMYCQTSGGRSFSSWVISQSSHMRHRSSTGPSRKACSSGVNLGFGVLSNLFQSGRPLNNSPSHQTVPASSASCSVCETWGKALRNQLSSGSLISARRSCGTISSAATIRNNVHSTALVTPSAPDHSDNAPRKAPMPMAHATAPARK